MAVALVPLPNFNYSTHPVARTRRRVSSSPHMTPHMKGDGAQPTAASSVSANSPAAVQSQQPFVMGLTGSVRSCTAALLMLASRFI